MVSRTRMTELVRAWDWAGVDAALAGTPALLEWRDERGRNWLHQCCRTPLKPGGPTAGDSIRTADVLLARGLDIDGAAFTEGNWRATPLWHAVGWGRNLALADHLLKLGADPNHCLFAAVWNHDVAAMRLLVANGADLEERSAGESPFLGAIKWSRFKEAEALLDLGADVNHRDREGMTALHYMLKKSSDKAAFEMMIAHGARGDIPGADGQTAAEIMRRKRDPDFRRMADQLETAR